MSRKNGKNGRPSRKLYDAQICFQVKRCEKAAIKSLINGREFRYEGDVWRMIMDEFFERHNINPQDFANIDLVSQKS
jgi:hypothetical protein